MTSHENQEYNAGAKREFGGDLSLIRRLCSICMFIQNMEAEQLTKKVCLPKQWFALGAVFK